MQLFISPRVPLRPVELATLVPLRPVKLATLRRWIKDVLHEAGVNEMTRSTQATAVACALLHGDPLQLRHYMRVLPEETLQSAEAKQSSVQDVVLPTV